MPSRYLPPNAQSAPGCRQYPPGRSTHATKYINGTIKGKQRRGVINVLFDDDAVRGSHTTVACGWRTLELLPDTSMSAVTLGPQLRTMLTRHQALCMLHSVATNTGSELAAEHYSNIVLLASDVALEHYENDHTPLDHDHMSLLDLSLDYAHKLQTTEQSLLSFLQLSPDQRASIAKEKEWE